MADDKFELRSEKVRHIIGEIPSSIVRYGIIVITIITFGLLVLAYFIPYTETVDANIKMENAHQGTIRIPYEYVNIVKTGMAVRIELEGYSHRDVHAKISSISHAPLNTGKARIFSANVRIIDCTCKKGDTGKATILISDESLLKRIIGQKH
jgi:hypothetical protein